MATSTRRRSGRTARETALWAALLAGPLLASCGGGRDHSFDTVGVDQETRTVFVEIDSMEGVPLVPHRALLNGVPHSLDTIFQGTGLKFDLKHDQRIPAVEKASSKDLRGIVNAHRNADVPQADVWKLYGLVAKASDVEGRRGELLHSASRDTFVVFTSDVTGAFSDLELLRRVAHELSHCMNLHHSDFDGQSFYANSTIESYSDVKSLRWSLSPKSVSHLLSDPSTLVVPGSGSPFRWISRSHHTDHKPLNERFRFVDDSAHTLTLATAVGGGAAFVSPPDLRDFAVSEVRELEIGEVPGLAFSLHASKVSYLPGELVYLTAQLVNSGPSEIPVNPYFDPEYGFLALEVANLETGRTFPYEPLSVADTFAPPFRALESMGSVAAEFPIFFGIDGWVFEEPGRYRIRAIHPVLEENELFLEAQVELEIRQPEGEDSETAELILGDGQGLFLVDEGGARLEGSHAALRQVVEEFPEAGQTPSIQLALALAALNPAVDPWTGVRQKPELAEALGLLDGLLEPGFVEALSRPRILRGFANLAASMADVEDARERLGAALTAVDVYDSPPAYLERRARSALIEALKHTDFRAGEAASFRESRPYWPSAAELERKLDDR